jgi:uncharacterized protein YbjT (DUF2867 family)
VTACTRGTTGLSTLVIRRLSLRSAVSPAKTSACSRQARRQARLELGEVEPVAEDLADRRSGAALEMLGLVRHLPSPLRVSSTLS